MAAEVSSDDEDEDDQDISESEEEEEEVDEEELDISGDDDDDDELPEDELKMIIGDSNSRGQAQTNAGKKFDELDVDNDGVVSPEELMGILEDSKSISEKDKKGAADLLAALDLDGDGKVDRTDWVRAFG